TAGMGDFNRGRGVFRRGRVTWTCRNGEAGPVGQWLAASRRRARPCRARLRLAANRPRLTRGGHMAEPEAGAADTGGRRERRARRPVGLDQIYDTLQAAPVEQPKTRTNALG